MLSNASIFLHENEALIATIRPPAVVGGRYTITLGDGHSQGSFYLHGSREQIAFVIAQLSAALDALRQPAEVTR